VESKLEHLIHRILSGKQTILHNGIRYTLKNPSLDLMLEADLLYNDIYQENLYENFYRLEDINNLLIRSGIVHANHNQIIDTLKNQIDKLKIELYKNYFNLQSKRKNKQKIDNLISQLNSQYILSHYLDFLTLEKYCENIRHEFIISRTLYEHESDKLVFDYSDIQDYELFNSFINQISNQVLDVSTLKKIALSEYWRNYYANNKHNLLPYSACDYSEEQKALINISEMYESIYQHPECPAEDIIQDEYALDGWMLDQKEKNKREKSKKGVDNILNDKIKNSQEVFLAADRNDKETLEMIESLNNAQALKIKKERSDLIQQQGSAEHSDFSDIKQEIKQMNARIRKGKIHG